MRCYNCQGLGHRAAECTSRSVSGIWTAEEEVEDDVREVGGVWMVVNVKEETWRKMEGPKKKADATVKVENQFKILEVDEDEDDKNYFIGNVEKVKSWLQVGAGEITIDSAADESVCPPSWGRTFPTRLVP